jgi:hypothetical protein
MNTHGCLTAIGTKDEAMSLVTMDVCETFKPRQSQLWTFDSIDSIGTGQLCSVSVGACLSSAVMGNSGDSNWLILTPLKPPYKPYPNNTIGFDYNSELGALSVKGKCSWVLDSNVPTNAPVYLRNQPPENDCKHPNDWQRWKFTEVA